MLVLDDSMGREGITTVYVSKTACGLTQELYIYLVVHHWYLPIGKWKTVSLLFST